MADYARGRDALTVAAVAVVGIIAFALLFLYVTNRGLSLRRSDLYVRLPSAEGLRKGDGVFFRGVQVGNVNRLTFTDEGDVVVRTRLLEPVPLTSDAVATLVAVDMFGRQSVVLREGDFRGRRLADGDTLTGVPPVTLTTQMSELGRNAGRLTGDTTTALLHAALGQAGEASISVAALTREMQALMAAQRESLTLLTRSAAAAAHNVEVATDSAAIVRLREHTERTMEGLARVTARLDTSAMSVATLLDRVGNGEGTAGMLLNDPLLYHRTEALLASMEELVRDVKQNPGRYINVKVF